MEKGTVSGFAAMGMAAAIIVPLSYGAQGRETRAERSASTISQSTDRADARIAILKADLRLSSDLHDVVISKLANTFRQTLCHEMRDPCPSVTSVF
jgi:hypothetical protein